MEWNNKPSTSRAKSDTSDDDEDYDKVSTTDDLCVQIKTYRNLFFGNKINAANAFDIDMIGTFFSWLEKNKPLAKVDKDDVTTFQQISDYLEASSKVYSYRVDNLIESTSNLVEQFKKLNNNKSTTIMDDDIELKTEKLKRPNLMLTTSDKLRRTDKLFEDESTFDDSTFIKSTFDECTSFNFKELFNTGRPCHQLISLYHGKSLAETMKISNDENDDNDDGCYMMEDIDMEQLVICPEFNNFVADRDKVNNSKDDQLEGIEYHFDPDIQPFQNNIEDLNCDVSDNIEPDFNSTTVLDGLLECIDNVDRDYSFFNPQLLAKWNGPKAWKAKAMAKALKRRKPIEQKDIVSNIDDNILQENIKQTKTSKNRNIVKNDNFTVKWLNMSQIDKLMVASIKGKEQLLPSTLLKWNALDNISKSNVVDIKYKSKFLQYAEITPNWMISHENQKKEISAQHSNFHFGQNINYCDKTIVETQDSSATEMNYEDTEKLMNENDGAIDDKEKEIDDEGINDNFCNLDGPRESDPEDDNNKTEPKLCIENLYKEISDIIDEECVETDPKSEWSSKLSFITLLIKLRINERDELSMPIVFVGLLHLANERGLKLLQENCTMNDTEEDIFIVKPMNIK